MKFTQSILVAVAALSIGPVVAQNRFRNGRSSSAVSSVAASSSAAVSSATAAASAAATSAAIAGSGTGSGKAANANTCLQANALQTGSASAGGAVADAGQSDSATDAANFINFCAGKTLTNGLQVKGGSCNGIPMGNIPSTANMISTVITFPTGDPNDPKQIVENTPFQIVVKTTNLAAGVFTNPATTYYSAPQDLTGGVIIGHSHVTVQSTGGSFPTSPMDPGTFGFFKGMNQKADAQGQLTADVTAGLPAGFYRVCTMTSAANHQPVTMPIAQRGAQDDCRYFSVVKKGTAAGGAAAGGAASSSSAAGSAATGATQVASSAASGAAVASSTSAAASASTTTGTSSGRRRFGSGRGRGRFAARAYIA